MDKMVKLMLCIFYQNKKDLEEVLLDQKVLMVRETSQDQEKEGVLERDWQSMLRQADRHRYVGWHAE